MDEEALRVLKEAVWQMGWVWAKNGHSVAENPYEKENYEQAKKEAEANEVPARLGS